MQLLAFVNASNHDAVNEAARELGYANNQVAAGNVNDAVAYLKANASPELLLVEIGNAEEAPAQLDALADVVNPLTKVFVAGKTDSIRFYQWLSDLGIEGYLLLPFTAAEFKQAIAKGSMRPKEGAQKAADVPRKLVAVMGARGGVGTTLIATNLAAILARTHHQPTGLIDLDSHFGTVSLSFDLEPSRGMRDAFEKPDRVDGLFLERVMIKPFDGLSILSAEEPLNEAITIQPNAGELVFAALREKFPLLVVDVPRQMNPLTRYVLSMADVVVMVADPLIGSVRDALRVKDYVVDSCKRPAPLLVVNRVGLSAANELTVKEFGKNYGHEAAAHFAYLPEVLAATSEGALLETVPKLRTAFAPLTRLANSIMGVAEGEAKPTEETHEKASPLTALFKGKK